MKLEKLEIKVLCGLRVAAYQLLFLDRIPASAAVNEAVELAKRHSRNPRTAGMVNGVLRALLREGKTVEITETDKVKHLSVQYSHPQWLVEEFIALLGPEGAQALLEEDNRQPPTTAQVNTLKTTAEKLAGELREAGVEIEPHPWLAGCLLLTGTGDLERLAPFQRGSSMSRTRPQGWQCWQQGLYPASGCWTAAPPPGASPLPPPSPWKTGGADLL